MQETWVGKIPWRREGLPTPVFWPGEFYVQRSLVGYSPWGHQELDTTERLSLPRSRPRASQPPEGQGMEREGVVSLP